MLSFVFAAIIGNNKDMKWAIGVILISMFTIARDGTNDIYLDGKGQLATVEGADASVQIVDARVKTLRGEMQLNISRGVPYFATIMRSLRYLPYWEASMRETILASTGVSGINSFRYSVDGETLSYVADITTSYGTTVRTASDFEA